MMLTRLIPLLFLAGLALPAAAQDAADAVLPEGTFSLLDVLALADRINPEIAAARAEAEGARGRVREARNYPNPFAELGGRETEGDDNGEWSATIGQPVIVGSRRNAEIRLRQAEAEAADLALEATRRRVLHEVAVLYSEVLYHLGLLDLAWRIVENADATRAAAEQRGTTAAPGDLDRAIAEAERARLEITRHASELTYALQDIAVPLAEVDFRAEQFGGELMRAQDNVLVRAAQAELARQHPALLADLRDAEAAALAADWARARVVPDVTIGLTAGYSEMASETFGGLSLRVPLPLFDRNEGEIAAEESAAAVRRAEAEDTGLRLARDLAEASQRINEFDTFVGAYLDEVVPRQNDALAAVRQRYVSGNATLTDLLETQRQWQDSEETLLLYRLELTRAHLVLAEFVAGTPDEWPDPMAETAPGAPE